MSTSIAESPVHDAQLVERSLLGDTGAFGGIVERYQGLICGLAYSACGNAHLSEDLAQETFIAAWRQLRDLREAEKLNPTFATGGENPLILRVHGPGRLIESRPEVEKCV